MQSSMRPFVPAAIAMLLASCGDQHTPSGSAAAKPAISKDAAGITATLTNVEVDRSIDSSGVLPEAPAGATYLVVTYGLKNTGAEPLTLDRWPQARLVDPAGHRLQAEALSSTFLSAAANPSWAEPLNPNLATELRAAWKVDAKAFDRETWKLELQAKPTLTFPLS